MPGTILCTWIATMNEIETFIVDLYSEVGAYNKIKYNRKVNYVMYLKVLSALKKNRGE